MGGTINYSLRNEPVSIEVQLHLILDGGNFGLMLMTTLNVRYAMKLELIMERKVQNLILLQDGL